MAIFPHAPASGTSSLPPNARFELPALDEIDDETGPGGFHHTWLIQDVPVHVAQEYIEIERGIAEVVDRLSPNAETFERLAQLAESAGINDPAYGLSDREHADLAGIVSDFPELDGLELGVAGLTNALAAVGILPLASCRSHQDEASWSNAPVVVFAATEAKARALEPLAAAAGCTFECDPGWPAHLHVRATSIAQTMTLAEAIIENRADFA
jgi:hypothetical protein